MSLQLAFNPLSGEFDYIDVFTGIAGHVIQDEGTPLPQRGTMNFVGSAVTATDAGGVTVVTINAQQTNAFAFFAS